MDDNPLLIADKLPKRASYGRAFRAFKRAKKKHRIQKEVINLIEDNLPGLSRLPADTQGYENKVLLLLDIIDDHYGKPSDRHIARWFLSTFIDRGNNAGYWELAPPPALIKLRRDPQMRTIAWDNAASKASQLNHDFQDSLNKLEDINNLTHTDILSLISLTAIFYGGLNNVSAISTLLKELSSGAHFSCIQIENYSLLWIDLIYNDNRINNIYIGDDPYRYTRWYPDTYSLGLYNRYLQSDSKKSDISVTPRELFNLLKGALKKLDIQIPFTSINALCKAGAAVFEAQPSVCISSSLIETLTDRNVSVSLVPEIWEHIVSNREYEPKEISLADSNCGIPSSTGKQRKKEASKSVHYGPIVKKLSNALKPFDKTGQKRSITVASLALEELNTEDWPSMANYLHRFFKYLLDIRNLKPKTVLRYHNEITNALLLEDSNFPLECQSPEDLYLTYKQMVDERKLQKSKHYRAGRLDDFHQFAELNFEFPVLLTKISDGHTSIPMVRTGYINKNLYKSTLQSLLKLKDSDPVTSKAFAVLFIVAYRTGLRLQELVKLRLCDIESSADYWIFVRGNKFGDNKRSAMPRKIPLASLLTDEELILWEAYFGHRNQVSNNDGELLFCHDGLGIFPFDPVLVSRLISNALRNVSGITSLTFHHLRHTALSNLHMMAEREFELVAFLTGYTQNQIEKIFVSIIGNENEELRVYWGLASFAGHNTPQTTLQSYTHFNDLICHLKAVNNTATYNITQCKSISSLSSNRLSRLIHQYRITPDEIRIEILRESLINQIPKRLISYTNEYSSTNVVDDDFEVLSLKRIIQPSHAHEILSKYLEGISLPTLVYRYNVKEEKILGWIANMEYIATLYTKKGKPRLVRGVQSDDKKAFLLPHKPKSRIEELDSFQIITSMRNKMKNEPDNLMWAVKYFLTHTTKSSSGILFNSPDGLVKFLKTLSPDIIPKKRWLLIIHSPGISTVEFKIETRLEKSSGKSDSFSSYLYLKHPDENDYLDNKKNRFTKYSASTLRYVFHMVGIMALKLDA